MTTHPSAITEWSVPAVFFGWEAPEWGTAITGSNVSKAEGELIRFVATAAVIGDEQIEAHLVVTVDPEQLCSVHFADQESELEAPHFVDTIRSFPVSKVEFHQEMAETFDHDGVRATGQMRWELT